MPSRTRKFTHLHRQRLERAGEVYLRDCYRRSMPVRVSDFAARLGVTLEYLSRIAPEILGMPISDHLRRQQIAHAATLLETTPLTAEYIAVRSGFGTVATFYRWFHIVHGMTPGAFREVKK